MPRKAPDDKIKFVCSEFGSVCYVEHVHAIRISRYLFGSGFVVDPVIRHSSDCRVNTFTVFKVH